MTLNRTHDPKRQSWVTSAQAQGTDFPIQNLPFATYSTPGDRRRRTGVAIGDQVLDIRALAASGLLPDVAQAAAEVAATGLDTLMATGPDTLSRLRLGLSDLLATDGPHGPKARETAVGLLTPMADVLLHLPCPIRGYSDFLASEHHTERNGRLKGLSDPIPPQYRYVPVAYHGRPSSIVVSGTPVQRPNGQWRNAQGQVEFGPVAAMDFELELGILIGQGNPQGQPIRLDDAPRHIFGYCLLNDWSSKQVQWWEQMLGPFLGKNFATSISPWVVTSEALAPFRAPAPSRDPALAPLLPYLDAKGDRESGGFDLSLTAALVSAQMRESGTPEHVVTRTQLGNLCWTPAQLVTHHSSNGCNLETGDLLGTGTISGASEEARACMTELTSAGTQPLTLPNGQHRAWLEDGDEVVLRARTTSTSHVPIGFGECRGRILPATPYPG